MVDLITIDRCLHVHPNKILVVTIDCRGYGLSTGTPSGDGLLMDAATLTNYQHRWYTRVAHSAFRTFSGYCSGHGTLTTSCCFSYAYLLFWHRVSSFILRRCNLDRRNISYRRCDSCFIPAGSIDVAKGASC